MKNTRTEFLSSSKNKKIICFGAGRLFRTIKNYIESEGRTITIVVDNDIQLHGKVESGIVIQSPEILKECSGEEYLIFISNRSYATEIEKQVREEYKDKFEIFSWPIGVDEYREFDEQLWHERIYKVCEYFYTRAAQGLKAEEREAYMEEKRKLLLDKDKVILPRTPLMITTRCSLRCEECANLMPYYTKPKDYSADEIITWIKNICENIDEWICLELVGGEPFIYKDLERVFSYVLKEEKIQTIEFATNGTILPEGNILSMLKNRKVIVKVSEYPNVVNYERIIRLLEENEIRHELVYSMKWTKTGGLESRRRSVLELQTQYLNCGNAKNCRTILNGKLYVCSKAASLMELGIVDNLESVDLSNKNQLREDLRNFLRLTYSYACDYCDWASSAQVLVEPAKQIDR